MNEAVFRAAARQRQVVPQDKLDRLRLKAIEARDIEKEIEDLQNLLKEKSEKLRNIYHKELPDLMDEAGTDTIGLPADGNMPAYDAKLLPYYSANIAASWSEDRRAAAFKLLEEEFEAGDLIKTEVNVPFAKEKREEAKKLVAQLEKKGFITSTKEGVHSGTLTSWLKALVEEQRIVPTNTQLEILGATIGRVVKLKARKDG